MKKGTIINFNKNSVLIFLKNNKIIIMLTIAFIIGVAAGCFSFAKSSVASNAASNIFDAFLAGRQGRGFLKIFSYSFGNRFSVLLLYFLCGASLMGIIFIPLTTFTLGLFYGIFSAYTCATYLLKGITFNALILIPTTVIFIMALLVASGKSINFSFEFVKLTFPNSRQTNLFSPFKEYCGHYLIFLSLTLVSSVVDALLSKALISYFEFI